VATERGSHRALDTGHLRAPSRGAGGVAASDRSHAAGHRAHVARSFRWLPRTGIDFADRLSAGQHVACHRSARRGNHRHRTTREAGPGAGAHFCRKRRAAGRPDAAIQACEGRATGDRQLHDPPSRLRDGDRHRRDLHGWHRRSSPLWRPLARSR